jgi:hypothetical protein
MKASVRLLVLAASFAAYTSGLPQSVGPAFSITLSTAHSTVEAGREIRVQITATVNKPTLLAGGTTAERDYYVSVLGPDGAEPPTSEYLNTIRGGGTKPAPFMIDPPRTVAVPVQTGQTFTEALDVTAMFGIRRPGTYTIEASRRAENGTWVVSDKLPITVIARKVPLPPAWTAERPSAAAFSLTIWVNRPRVDSPMLLDVVTRNTSDRTITLDAAKDYKDLLGSVYKVDLVDAIGNPPPETDLARSRGNRGQDPPTFTLSAPKASGGVPTSLSPGQQWHDPVSLYDLYRLSPGEYTVQVRRWDPETRTWVRSNAITDTYAP